MPVMLRHNILPASLLPVRFQTCSARGGPDAATHASTHPPTSMTPLKSTSVAEVVRAPDISFERAEGGRSIAALSGAWDIRALESRARLLARSLADAARDSAPHWDLRQVQRLDHVGALLLWQAWHRKRPVALMLRAEHELFFQNLEQASKCSSDLGVLERFGFIRNVGGYVLRALDHVTGIVALLGQVLIDASVLIRRPWLGPWREISANVFRIGTQALGITAAVGFLIGVSLSYLSAEQLKTFGANAFIVNILGIGVIRELGTVICAVLVAGRSGSAITAQLGVMRVTEELDAMSVMGIPHTVRLILPKVIALAIALPLLMLWTSGISLVGGAISAKLQLGISIKEFLIELPAAVPIINLWLAIAKGAVFGVLIALIACHFGLRIQPNTESLGAGTTDSVVSAITAVIIADAIFAILFKDVGIKLI